MLLSMISKKLATYLSFILGPVMLLPLLLTVLILRTNVTHNHIQILFLILFIFQICIPLSYVLIAYKLKRIHDLDMSKKEERIIPIIISAVGLLISLMMIKLVGSPLLFNLFILLSILLLINGVITVFWKISFHMGINVISALLINFLYHWQFPVFYLTIPIIYWSRLELKRHTHAQLIVAFLLNSLIILFFLRKFNYL